VFVVCVAFGCWPFDAASLLQKDYMHTFEVLFHELLLCLQLEGWTCPLFCQKLDQLLGCLFRRTVVIGLDGFVAIDCHNYGSIEGVVHL